MINKVILLGNLGKDPEVRYTQNNMAVGSFSLATSSRRKDQNGQWVDQTEWHNIRVFGKTAENCQKYLKKGRTVYIDGRIQTRKWQDKEGKDRWTTEIIVNELKFVGGGAGASSNAPEMNNQEPDFAPEQVTAGKNLVTSLPSADSVSSSEVPFSDDDIPF